MVKPPRTMQPEAVDMEKAGRAAGKAFQDDSFRNYMARKIDLQRKQFGVVVPPPPQPPRHSGLPAREMAVSFAPDVPEHNEEATTRRRKRKPSRMARMLKRLKRRHGNAVVVRIESEAMTAEIEQSSLPGKTCQDGDDGRNVNTAPCPPSQNSIAEDPPLLQEWDQTEMTKQSILNGSRPDLFLMGVVVIINGYTHPDNESLQRMLQQHGGDVERYETVRITHIIAEHLSTAKAKIYAGQKKPTPVVHPSWIVDCVKEQRRLPHAPYLLPEVRDMQQQPSVASFFQPKKSVTTQGSAPENRTPELGGNAEPIPSCELYRPETDRPVATATSIEPSTRKESMVNPYAKRSLQTEKTAEKNPPEKVPTSSTTDTNRGHVPFPSGGDCGHQQRGRTDEKYIDGQIRTAGTDPNFLVTFFAQSRLSFIGSFRQRACGKAGVIHPTAPSGSRPPERYILHVDMDSFFAAVVIRNYPEYKDKPVAICHFGKSGPNGAETARKDSTSECATINYEARKFGLKKGMFLGRAREMCPSLVVLPYDFEGYEEVSEQVSAICLKYAGEYSGRVETVSCDESYMEVFVDNKKTVQKMAEDLRQEIFEATRCTATVGIASNKLLAKLATDKVKPNKSFMASEHTALMQGLQLRDLPGIGYRSHPKLAERGLVTVQDVWSRGDSAEAELQATLGKQLGTKIFDFCHGRDERPVEAVERKTIGAECNYGVRFDGPYGIDHFIDGLCKEVQKRMEHVGVTGAKVTLKVKQRKEGAKPPPKFLGHGSCHNLSKSVDMLRPSRDWKTISRACSILFKDMKVPKDDVRGMGVVVSKLSFDGASATAGIESFFQKKNTRELEDECVGSTKLGRSVPARNEPPSTSDHLAEGDGIASDDQHCETRPEGADANDDTSVEMMNLSQSSPYSLGLEDSSSIICHQLSDSPLNSGDPSDNDRCPLQDKETDKSYSCRFQGVSLACDGAKGEELSCSPQEDFEIPSLSQIHMSQVAALPSPMRRKIQCKMEKDQRAAAQVVPTPASNVTASHQPLYRQTNVKRMMRLAALKAGQGDQAEAADISLTQLDRLPVEVQLQIANNDSLSLGISSPRKRFRSKAVAIPTIHRPRAVENHATPPNSAETSRLEGVEEEASPLAICDCSDSESVFFQENILPLLTFLDENVAGDDSVNLLQEFFTIFAADHSWYQVVLLLRSILRRDDIWSVPSVFLPLFNHVNEIFHQETSESLCLLQLL